MNWYNRENKTFKPTVKLMRESSWASMVADVEDRRPKRLRGMLPELHLGNPNWMWEQTPAHKTKSLQLPSTSSPQWGIDHGHPGDEVPIPAGYFGGIGLGYQCSEDEDLLLEFNEKEGKIQKKEWFSSIVFNDESLAQSLKKNRYDLFAYLRELVGGGVWIRLEENRKHFYQNKILVKSTWKTKHDTIIQYLKDLRAKELRDHQDHLVKIQAQDIIS